MGFASVGLMSTIMGRFPDFNHPMTVIQDQTEEGQPSSHKVSPQPRLSRFTRVHLAPGSEDVTVAATHHKQQTHTQ